MSSSSSSSTAQGTLAPAAIPPTGAGSGAGAPHASTVAAAVAAAAPSSTPVAPKAVAGGDPLGQADDQLYRFYKLYADTIWEVQQLKEYDTEKVRAARQRAGIRRGG
jgi:hypothetical protein